MNTIKTFAWTLIAGAVTLPGTLAAQTAAPGQPVRLVNPIKADSIGELIDLVLKIVFQVAIPVAVFMVIVAGFRLVLAQGNDKKITEAKSMLLWTIVGLCVLLAATLIATVVKGTMCQIGSFEFCG